MASPFGCRSGHISAFAEATLPRDGQVGEGVSPALDAQTEKHNDPRRSTYSLQQRNDIECVAVIQNADRVGKSAARAGAAAGVGGEPIVRRRLELIRFGWRRGSACSRKNTKQIHLRGRP